MATMLCIAPMTVATKPGHRGEHEGNRKTIARGMPVIRLHLWRLRSCASSICTRGRGCWLKHPAFPAPSFRGYEFKARANLAAGTRPRVPDAAQRFFSGAPQRPGPKKTSRRIMSPGSAAHHFRAALHPGHESRVSILKTSGVQRALFQLARLRLAPSQPSRGFHCRGCL